MYIYVEFAYNIKEYIVLRLITWERCQIVIWYRFTLPGPMGGFPRSLQTDKRPPNSIERKRGLNPSPLQTRSGANFALFTTPNIRV